MKPQNCGNATQFNLTASIQNHNAHMNIEYIKTWQVVLFFFNRCKIYPFIHRHTYKHFICTKHTYNEITHKVRMI